MKGKVLEGPFKWVKITRLMHQIEYLVQEPRVLSHICLFSILKCKSGFLVSIGQ